MAQKTPKTLPTLQELIAQVPDFLGMSREQTRDLFVNNLMRLALEKGSIPANIFILCNLFPDEFKPVSQIGKSPKKAAEPEQNPYQTHQTNRTDRTDQTQEASSQPVEQPKPQPQPEPPVSPQFPQRTPREEKEMQDLLVKMATRHEERYQNPNSMAYTKDIIRRLKELHEERSPVLPPYEPPPVPPIPPPQGQVNSALAR